MPEGFPPVDFESWRSRVEAELEGWDFERTLGTPMVEGVSLAPLYAERPDSAPPLPRDTGWALWEERAFADPARIAAALGDEPTRLHLRTAELRASSDSLRRLPGDLVGLSLQAGAEPLPWVAALREAGIAPAELRLGADPLGAFARSGALPGSWKELTAEWRELAPLLETDGKVALLRVDTAPYHEAGSNAVQELAFCLATAHAYLAARPDEIAEAPMEIALEVSSGVLLEAAKLRAARWLLAKLFAGWQQESAVILHANTSRRMLSRFDPWVNVLRSSHAVFAAAVGGADSIVCRPFDERLGEPSTLGLRLARNTQLVLAREGHVDRVADPARGSFAIETLTDQLAREAWAVFQQIESAGGMTEALVSGWVRTRVDASARERAQRIARRQDPLTGVSEYPLAGEELLERPPRPRWPSKATERRASGPAIEPFTLLPDAAPFEALREAAQTNPPLAFLANLGPRSEYGPRSTWTRQLLIAGGFDVEEHEGSDALEPEAAAEALADAARASEAALVVVCASDARQATHGEALVRALAANAPRRLGWAGRPADREAALRSAGVTDFLFAGADVVEQLTELLAAVGVPRIGKVPR